MVIQGMVINGILTRYLSREAPRWMTVLITLLIGILVTFASAYLQPKPAMVCTIGVMVAYFMINGVVLFSWQKIMVGAAAPLTAAFLVWSTLFAVRTITDATHKAKVKKRFSSYVDPTLVNYVMENIDTVRFDGLVRDMTVVFTDLAGFTALSERLRERTVPLLNEYMSLMLPLIRKNNGIWDKFLGDGIMFYFNAPYDNPNHARDAVATVLEMQKAVVGFNKHLKDRGLQSVAMRPGSAPAR